MGLVSTKTFIQSAFINISVRFVGNKNMITEFFT